MITINGNRTVDWREGLTVQMILDELGWGYVLITVTVDGQFVPKEDYAAFPVPDGSDLKAIHIAHGG